MLVTICCRCAWLRKFFISSLSTCVLFENIFRIMQTATYILLTPSTRVPLFVWESRKGYQLSKTPQSRKLASGIFHFDFSK